jgi:hypothetical protein
LEKLFFHTISHLLPIYSHVMLHYFANIFPMFKITGVHQYYG